VKNLLHVEPGEGPKVLALFSYLFCVVGVGIAGKAARDSYFLTRYDRSLLPLMLVACAASVVLVVTLYAWLSKRLSTRALFHLSNAVFTASVILMSLRLQGWTIPFLYVWIDVVNEIGGLQFWLRAADILNPREAKRLFGPIGAGSAAAGVVVGFGLKPFVRAFGSGSLLYLVAGMIAASWILALIAARYERPDAPPPKLQPSRVKRRRLDPYLGTIAVVVAVSAVASLLVDYQFKIIAARSIPHEGALAAFFGQFYAFAGIASLAVQLFLSPFVLSRYGVMAGLLVFPLLMNAGSFAILFRSSLFSAVFTKGTDQTFKHTLNRSASELLWMPVAPAVRQAAKPFVTSSVKSCAEAASGLATFFLVKSISLEYLSVISIVATAIWIYGCVRLRSLYAAALARAIEKRQIDFEELTVDAEDPAMVAVIRRALESGDAIQQLFVLDLISGLPLAPWAGDFERLLREGTDDVRKRVLSLAGHDRTVLPDAAIEAVMREENDVAAQAILAAGERRDDRLLPEFDALLASPIGGTRLAAAAVILRAQKGAAGQARAILTSALTGTSDEQRKIALELLAGNAEVLTPPILRECLGKPSANVREAALEVAAERKDAALIPAIIANLDSPATAAGARRALESFAPQKVLPCLAEALQDTDRPAHRKAPVIDALLAIARSGGIAPEWLERFAPEREKLIHSAWVYNRVLCLLPEGPEGFLLRDYLQTERDRMITLLLKLGALARPQAPVEACLQIIRARDAPRLPFVLELLDSMFPHAERALIYPLIEPLSSAGRDARAGERLSGLPADLDAYLLEASKSHGQWESAIALDYLRRTNRAPREHSDLEARTTMYSTLEKTIFLKSVDLFGKIPAEALSRVAQVTGEKTWPAETPVFRDGDQGSSMFIVLDGAVRIHKGGRELAILRRGGCFGEMSLLDGSPRSADATACEESILFEIQEDSFYEALSGHVEIAQGVIRLLAGRLRDADRKLAQAAG
jgi:ATP/ADP translocase